MGIWLLIILAAASISSANSAFRRAERPAAIPSTSSRFHPVRILPENAGQLARFKILASRYAQDSTRHWEVKHDRLEISYDLMQDLAAGNLADTGGGLGGKTSGMLARRHGLKFHPTGAGFGDFQPNDEWYAGAPQWALRNSGLSLGDRPGKAGVDIDIERVWDKFDGNDSLVIAVVDAGFDFHHPDLQGKHWINAAETKGKPGIDDDQNGYVDDSLGWDFVDSDNLPEDFHGHGTYCSSVIAAGFDNSIGMAGAVPRCRIMPVRVLDASGSGSQDDIAKGIMYALDNGAMVINFSIGGDIDNAPMRNAFQAARDRGVPIIVAAGNSASDLDANPAYPVAYAFDNMLVVAAHDHAGLLSSFSNFGRTSVDLAAPGEWVLAAGIPDPKEVWTEDFESTSLVKWSATGFALSATSPIANQQSLLWTSGANVSAVTADYLDLTGKEGCVLHFQMEYHPANTADVLIVEGNAAGSALWKEIGIFTADVAPTAGLAFGLQEFDGLKFKLRFRTSDRSSTAGRRLKIDALKLTEHDPHPTDEAVYRLIAGTSIAAPYVTAYVGLQRLACHRMGLPWTREKALAGVVPEAALAGKVQTGGRLDMFKGLQFYLSTLPDFHLLDSTAYAWRVGDNIHYAWELVPAPGPEYSYSFNGLGANALVDGMGKLSWQAGPNDTGWHAATLLAEGPTTLRKRFDLRILPGMPTAASLGPNRPPQQWRAKSWLVGDRKFSLRPGWEQGNHFVMVWGIDVSGKTQLLKSNWANAADFQHPWAIRANLSGMVQILVEVDGIPLSFGQ